MRPLHPIALAAFIGFMVAAASTANDQVEPPTGPNPLVAAIQTAAGSAAIRIPDPVALPSTRPAPKIVVDLK